MTQKIPPPPDIARLDPVFNRWLVELTSVLNGGGNTTLTGTPTAPTAPVGTNTTQIATTAFVHQNTASAPSTTVPLVDATPGAVGTSANYARADHVHPTDTTRAPLNSPGLTGTPTAPTPTPGDNSTKLATTAFVDGALASYAPLASPALTGTPTAPTAAPGDNTTTISTTAFVEAAIAALPALRNGSGAPAAGLGTNNDWYGDTTNKHIYIKTGGAWVLII